MKKLVLMPLVLLITTLSLTTKVIDSTDYSDLNQKEILLLIEQKKQITPTYHTNRTINKMIIQLNQLKEDGILTEDYLMDYIFASKNAFLSKNARIIADPDGGYWSCQEGSEGDGSVKLDSNGVPELNLFSAEATSVGELQEAVLAWYQSQP
ncbi:hypothetical protein ACVRY7_06605 [Streptococcus ictaluri]|uniref:Uncharacterized protein n=1 Tax=Streptococcus ictaluri 707-05 TaxID=764299 RepID=G5K4D5_9STRE|nr:hypothetical protein [Streptococcus ictaluri]EHI69217.1 hypothetical protein STRIC_1655 [Streptococcus ictaluri 707-05]